MASLYELDGALGDVYRLLEENGGELDEATEAQLQDLLDSRDDKVRAYIALMETFLEEAKGFASQKSRLASLEKSANGAYERLKSRLLGSMILNGEDKVKTVLGAVSVREAPKGRLTLKAGAKLPKRFLRVKIEPNLDALGAALDAGDKAAARLAYREEPTKWLQISGQRKAEDAS